MQIYRGGLAVGVIALVAASFYFTAPTDGDFWWSDAPRHALNGIFVKDLLRDLPLGDPKGYAYAQYAKFPALTILFYPPLFYLISAPFYAVFGVSHAVAQAAVALHMFALGLGVFVLSRRLMPWIPALAVAVAAISFPEVALWGRQVMLEVPSFAFAVWSALFLLRYTDHEQTTDLLLAIFLLLAGIWTKLSLAFLVPVFFLVLLSRSGFSLFRRPVAYMAAGLFVLGLLPLAAMTWYFGQANVQSVTGVADAAVPKWSFAGWTWYLRQLPDQVGWASLAVAAVGLVVVLSGGARGVNRPAKVLLFGWFLVGYVFFSMIDLKEARHSVYLLFPIAVFAGIALSHLIADRFVGVVSILSAIGVFAFGITRPVPAYSGYREAAEFVARQAPKNGIVMFSGKRDGSFIFNIRALEDAGGNLSVIRADKLLLRVAVRRELGVQQTNFSEDEIANLLGRAGVEYVVAQDDFWIDLDQMAKLQSVLRSGRFAEVRRIEVGTGFPQEDRVLRIYRNLESVSDKPQRLDLDLPIIGRTIQAPE